MFTLYLVAFTFNFLFLTLIAFSTFAYANDPNEKRPFFEKQRIEDCRFLLRVCFLGFILNFIPFVNLLVAVMIVLFLIIFIGDELSKKFIK